MEVHIKNFKHANDKATRGKTIAMICPAHGFIKGDHCPQCREEANGNKNI